MVRGTDLPLCFVLMPFAPSYDLVYDVIARCAKLAGYECYRSDKKKDLGLITQGIILDIVAADLVVADISGFNANVLYELGVAHVLGKPTIIISQELYTGDRLPFDITHMVTAGYQLPGKANDSRAKQLAKQLKRNYSASRIHDNPVTITLNARQMSLANYFGHEFLSGFEKTLSESKRARVAWIVSTKLFWERLDAMFYRRIFEQRILTGKRTELVLLPESEENRCRKEQFLEKYNRRNSRIANFLRIILVRDSRLFSFLSTEISIYDPHTPDIRAVLLEPMAVEGADQENDARIAAAIDSGSIRELRLCNLKEKTFDIMFPRDTAERLALAFQAIWNDECEEQNLRTWRI